MDEIAHEQTIRQLFAGHVVCSRPMKRKKKFHGKMIIPLNCTKPPGGCNKVSTSSPGNFALVRESALGTRLITFVTLCGRKMKKYGKGYAW